MVQFCVMDMKVLIDVTNGGREDTDGWEIRNNTDQNKDNFVQMSAKDWFMGDVFSI